MNEYGISDKSLSIIIETIKTYKEIEKAVLFGSRAKGNHKKGSDIDIALYGETADEKLALILKSKLNEETLIPYFCDVISVDLLNNFNLMEHIERVGKVFYQKNKTIDNG